MNGQSQADDGVAYDAFISYSHKDESWVRNVLLPRLEKDGVRVCIDFRDFEIGVPSLVNMENAVERSRKTLLVLTPNWVASEWTDFEALLVGTTDPAGRGRRILPLLVEPCSPPARLKIFTYLDLTRPGDYEFQFKRLVSAIRGTGQPTAPGTPAAQPSAPGPRPARGFNLERGLTAMGELLAQGDAEARLGFSALQARLLQNLQDERRYGSTETIRSERARIVDELNRLGLTYLNKTFNELCTV